MWRRLQPAAFRPCITKPHRLKPAPLSTTKLPLGPLPHSLFDLLLPIFLPCRISARGFRSAFSSLRLRVGPGQRSLAVPPPPALARFSPASEHAFVGALRVRFRRGGLVSRNEGR